MCALDPSWGCTAKQIGTIKFRIKRAIALRLPIFTPSMSNTELFMQGRDAWTFGWRLLNRNSQKSKASDTNFIINVN